MRPQTGQAIISYDIAFAEVMIDIALEKIKIKLKKTPMGQFWIHFWLSGGSFGVIFGRLGGCLEFLEGS